MHDVNNLLMGLVGCAEVAVSKLDAGAVDAAREAIIDLRDAARRGAVLTDRAEANTSLRSSSDATPEDVPLALGVVLLVEDDELVRRAARAMLADFSLTVLEAVDAAGALALARARSGMLDAIVCDVELPGAEAGGLLAELCRLSPGARPVSMSGAPRSLLLADGRIEPDVPFLAKPFDAAALRAALSVEPKRPRGRRGEPPSRERVVLLVEDDELMRTALHSLLGSWSYVAVAVSSAAAALGVIEREGARVGVVLTDLLLAGASGESLVRVLRGRGDDVPVIFMTGLREEDQLVGRALTQPGTQLLRKPFEADVLRRTIDAALARADTARAVALSPA